MPITNLSGGDFINVMRYGAIGDGTTDDAVAIAAAIAAAATGKIVYFPAGDYLISTGLTLANDETTLLGDLGATIVRGGNITPIRITGDRCSVENLRIDGKKATYAALSSCIRIEGAYNLIRSCELFDGPAHGINLDGQASTCNYNHVENCIVHDVDYVGIGQNTVTDSFISGNYIYNCGREGITIDVSAFRHRVIGNYVSTTCLTGGVAGISLDNGSLSIVSSNLITAANGQPGIRTNDNVGNTQRCIFAHNHLVSNGTWGIFIYNGMGGVASQNSMIGNVFQANGSGAILIDNGIDKSIVCCNMFAGQAYTNNGTNTVASGNQA